jgi:hypothetical protein
MKTSMRVTFLRSKLEAHLNPFRLIRKILRLLVYREIQFVQVRSVAFQPRLCIQVVLTVSLGGSAYGLATSVVDIGTA